MGVRTRPASAAAFLLLLAVVAAAATAAAPRAGRQPPGRLGLGTPATPGEIRRADTDVTPDGGGLPRDSGTVAAGEAIYRARCAACHGLTGTEGPFDRLVGREPGDSFNFARDPRLLARRTVGNYWPYATTLYDFINRAMPFDKPGSLAPAEVYGVTAYLLHRNGIIPANAVLSDRTLPLVRMPARDRFVPDDRVGGPRVR
jgi:S-disulfanyl-L-cysteine oxidoreductase SoxD